MVTRDPETGKFVAEEINVRDEIDQFGELVAQTWHWDFTLAMSNASGVDLPIDGHWGPSVAWGSTPLSGRLERNQVAELVYLEIDSLRLDIREAGNSGTTPGSAWLEFEVWCDKADVNVDSPPDVMDMDTIANNAEANGSTADFDTSSVYTEVAWGPGRLAWSEIPMHAAFNDTVQGTGGGGAPGHDRDGGQHFRRDFGRGPLLHGGDKMFGFYTLEWDDIDNQAIDFGGRTRAYWDIFEYDEEPLVDTVGPLGP